MLQLRLLQLRFHMLQLRFHILDGSSGCHEYNAQIFTGVRVNCIAAAFVHAHHVCTHIKYALYLQHLSTDMKENGWARLHESRPEARASHAT